jgi:hypothetical protein
MVRVHVTDHALMRYAERRYGIPMDKLRAEIEAKALPAAKVGAAFFQIENIKFALTSADHEKVVRVKTVLERHMNGNNRHIKKNRQEIEL